MSSEIDRAALEALIFASDGPISPSTIRRALPGATPAAIERAVAEINTALAESGRPYEIREIAGGWQFRTRAEFGLVILAAQPERKVRLSRAALETLALVAYRQPQTRAEIENLRGVDCGAVLKSLLERDLVRIVGRRDAPGRPALFGTTSSFLETFGLRALSDLPPLSEVEPLLSAPAETGDALAEELAPALGVELSDEPERADGDPERDDDEPAALH